VADFNAIASAVATRFNSSNVTAPSGETNVRAATHQLPQGIVVEPTVLVFPPEPGAISLTYNAGALSGVAVYPVRFYLWRIRDESRNSVLCLKWLGSLYAQLQGKVQLDLSAYVAHALIRNLGVGRLSYGGVEFEGIELEAEVHFWEALNAVA